MYQSSAFVLELLYSRACLGRAGLARRAQQALVATLTEHYVAVCLQEAAEKAKDAGRHALLAACEAAPGALGRRLGRWLLLSRFLLADHSHNALVLAVFGFKVGAG